MSHANGVGASAAYIKGVPHPLPAGETVLWEGAPTTRAVAAHVFHWHLFALYFTVMLGIWMFTTSSTFGSQDFLAALVVRVALSSLVVGIAWTLSRVVAGTSWYAITSRRVVLRVGMVFPMSINIPFSLIESAGIATFKDGSGQLVLTLNKSQRIAYIALWPHCRVLRFTQPEPVLRGLIDPVLVGGILAKAVAEAAPANSEHVIQRGSPHDASVDTRPLPQPAGA